MVTVVDFLDTFFIGVAGLIIWVRIDSTIAVVGCIEGVAEMVVVASVSPCPILVSDCQ